MRLRTKIALLLGLMTAVLMVIVSTVATVIFSNTVEDEIKEKVVATARESSSILARELLDGNAAAIQDSLALLLGSIEEASFAYLIGMDGEVAAHTFQAGFPADLVAANVLPAGARQREKALDFGGKSILDIGFRIIEGGAAEIHVGLGHEEVNAESRRLMSAIYLISLAVMTAGILVTIWMINLFTRPLNALADGATRFGSDGVYAELPVVSKDETGQLTEAFNRMARQLSATIEQLEKSERRYRSLIELAQEGFIIVDGSETITFVNDRFLELTGYARDELLGREILSLFAPDDLPEVRRQIARRREGDKGRYEATVMKKYGGLLHAIVSACPLHDEAGRFCGSFGLFNDITEHKKSEASLRMANETLEGQYEELRKIDRIKDGLIRDVTHELKTPVAKHAMQMEILREILGKHNLLGETGKVLEVIDRSIARQQHVIRNILNLARLEGGGRKYSLDTVSLDRVINSVLEDYHFTMEAHRIRLIKNLPPITIKSDGEMLWHVFSNLVSNAIKFRGVSGRPTISVLAECRDDHVLVTVTDNGIGLAPEIKDRVFDRFFQVSAVVEGSGVGLTIAKMIVEDLGGTITLASEGAGRGTSVGIALPLDGRGQSP